MSLKMSLKLFIHFSSIICDKSFLQKNGKWMEMDFNSNPFQCVSSICFCHQENSTDTKTETNFYFYFYFYFFYNFSSLVKTKSLLNTKETLN